MTAVRAITRGDLPWMATLMTARRMNYVRYAPRFWRPAQGVEEQHAAVMWSLADDFAVDADECWNTDGAALLLAAWDDQRAQGVASMRVVTARLDTAKVALLRARGLAVGEEWWVKEVEPAESSAPFGPVEESGFAALRIPAPPVYDPGGPVLLVARRDDASVIRAVDVVASRLGCVLAIVPARPDEVSVRDALSGRGYDAVSQFYDSQPR